MKRSLLMVIACAVLLLTACAATDPNNLFEVTRGDSTSGTEGTSYILDEQLISKYYYQYGNMQRNQPPGGFMLMDNKVVFKYIDGGKNRIYTYDLTDGKVLPYCQDATCTHRGSCSYGTLSGNVEVYKGKVYMRNKSLQPVEITEEGQKLIAPKNVTGTCFHHDDKLYIKTRDSALMVLEEGSDEPQMILKEYIGYWNVIFGQYLYANNFVDIIRVDLSADEPKEEVVVQNATGITDGQHIYYLDLINNYLYRCDMDGSNVQILVERSILPGSINFDDEYFYFRLFTNDQLDTGADCHDIYRLSKNDPTNIVKICTVSFPIQGIYTVPGTDKLFVTSYVRSNDECSDIYVIGTDGSNPMRLEIPEF